LAAEEQALPRIYYLLAFLICLASFRTTPVLFTFFEVPANLLYLSLINANFSTFVIFLSFCFII
jgi:hypothetical protein